MIGLALEFKGRVRRRFVEICRINDMNCYMLENKTENYDRVFVDIGNKNMYFVCFRDRIEELNKFSRKGIIDHAKDYVVKCSRTKDCKINLGIAEFFNVGRQAEMHNSEVEKFIREKEMIEYKERKRQEEERKRLQAIKWENRLDSAEKVYKEGGYIDREEFLGLCKRHQIDIPIRTLGAINKYVEGVSNQCVQFYGCKESSLGGTYKVNENLAIILNCCYNDEDGEEGGVDGDLMRLFFGPNFRLSK